MSEAKVNCLYHGEIALCRTGTESIQDEPRYAVSKSVFNKQKISHNDGVCYWDTGVAKIAPNNQS